MRVSIYREIGTTLSVLVQASPGSGKPPVLMTGVVKKDIKAVLGPVIEAMRGRREVQTEP